MRHQFAAFGPSLIGGGQQSRQFPQVTELDIGNWMTPRKRPLIAIDPNGADAGAAVARDVAIQTVAHHHRFVRRESQPIQGQLKNSEIRFPESMIARDYDRLE